jgi:uncharacterized membrane protein YagU involved in acid resistance
MPPTIEKTLAGATAGALATFPMSALMLIWHRRLPRTKRDPLPPAQIVNQLTEALGILHQTRPADRLAATVVAHFGYGSAMGALYGLTAAPQSSAAALPTGIAFGLGVWAGSYLGLLPASGLYRSATQEPAERNKMMIAAHLVWGASLGLIAHGLLQAATSSRGASRKTSTPPLRRYRRRIQIALQRERSRSQLEWPQIAEQF